MTRRTNPSEDDWRNVENARERKKIQDRLAQRARRQRLREAKNNAKRGSEEGETQRAPDTQHQQEGPSALLRPGADCWFSTVAESLEMVPLMPDAELSTSSSSASPSLGFEDFLPSHLANITLPGSLNNPIPTPQSSPIPREYPLTFYGALYINGMYLRIPCSTVVPAKSEPVGPEVPESLRPTELQLITIHPRWIDRFPFPKMRDSLISLSGVIDDEEFMRDLALIPSFEIVQGKAPWDPKAWRIKKPFAEKWGYLFF